MSLRLPEQIATMTPIRKESTKSLCPQGTSPTKESGMNKEKDNKEEGMSKDSMSLNLDSLVKSDPKELSSNKEGRDANSIANKIATLRTQLFKGGTQATACKRHEDGCNSTAEKASKKGSRRAKSWVPIAKGGSPKAKVPTRGAVFAEGTHFNQKLGKPLKKTLGKANSSTLLTSVI